MDASKIFEQQRAKEQKSLRRFLLYGGAGSLLLHGWLLGQSVLLPKATLTESQEDAIELTVVEPPPDIKLSEDPPPPPPEEARVEPEPVAVVPQIPTLDTPTPDPPKSNNETLDKPESEVTKDDAAVAKGKPNPAPNPLDGIFNGNPNSTGNTNAWNNLFKRPDPPKPSAAAPAAPPPPQPRKREKIRCIENCRAVYPESLRGKNVQGDPKVIFDVDASGNVSNVRLRSSSGNAELDAAAIEQAKKMKLTPSEGGRQNVPGRVDFQIEGSDYQRQSQERQRQREAERTTREQQEVAPAPLNPPAPTVTAPAPNPIEAPAAKRDAPAPAAPAAPEPVAAPTEPVAPPPAPTVEAPPPDPVYEAPAATVEAPATPEPAPAPEAAPPPDATE